MQLLGRKEKELHFENGLKGTHVFYEIVETTSSVQVSWSLFG